MADTSGMAELRGLDIDKLAKGFADEELKLKKYLNNTTTSNTEIRWYQKTAGFLDTPDTTGITASGIYNQAHKARPQVVEQSWTRMTSYTKYFFVSSPLFTEADLKDCDPDILATNIRDLVRAVQKQEDIRCYNVLTENLSPTTIQTAACYGTGWNDATNGNPIADILSAKAAIKAYSYEPEGAVMYINEIEEKNLLNWIITTKGANIPTFASAKVQDGVLLNLLGINVVSSHNATTDYALIFVPQRSATWKSFTPLTTAVLKDPGIGTTVRIWSEGEALLTDPKSVVLLTNTST